MQASARYFLYIFSSLRITTFITPTYHQINSVLNLQKCNCITFTRNVHSIHFNYFIERLQIVRINNIRDLAVIYDSKIIFNLHIESMANFASRILGYVKRICKRFVKINSRIFVYYAFVHSNLNFAGKVWYPHYGTNICPLDIIKRKIYFWFQRWNHFLVFW